jgi:hypothetical protein
MLRQGIETRLGLDNRDFLRGINQADRSVKQVGRNLSDIGIRGMRGGVVTALVGGFINAAKAIDETSESLDGLQKRSVEYIQNWNKGIATITDVAGRGVGAATAILEGLQAGVITLTRGIGAAQKFVAEKEKARDLARAEARAVKEVADIQQMLARAQAQYQSELNAATRDYERAIEKTNALEYERLSLQDKIQMAIEEQQQLMYEIATAGGDEVDQMQRRAALQASRNRLTEYQRDLQEDIAAKEKSANDERERQQQRIAQLQADVIAEAESVMRSQLSDGERLRDLEARIADERSRANSETEEGLIAMQNAIRLEQQRLDLAKSIADQQERGLAALRNAAQAEQRAQQAAQNAREQRFAPGLGELQSGARGTSAQQRAARDIARQQAIQARQLDRMRRAEETGDQVTMEDASRRFREAEERERELRENTAGLRDEDRDPFAREKEAIEAAKEQVKLAEEQLTELRLLNAPA